MGNAQNTLELVYALRSSAMGEIAEKMSTALGDVGAEKATAAIAKQMRTLLASDVIYAAVARPEINGVLADNGIEGDDVPKSEFLPDGTEWLDESKVTTALGSVSGSTSAETPGRPRPRPDLDQRQRHRTRGRIDHRASKRKKRPKSKSKSRTRANRPRTGSPSRSRPAEHRCRKASTASAPAKPATVIDPADPGAERRSDARSQGRSRCRASSVTENNEASYTVEFG